MKATECPEAFARNPFPPQVGSGVQSASSVGYCLWSSGGEGEDGTIASYCKEGETLIGTIGPQFHISHTLTELVGVV